MARLIATDSGAVEREIRRMLVVDSGGTARELKRLLVVDSGGTTREVFNASDLNTDLDGTTYNFSTTGTNPASAQSGVRIANDKNVYELAIGNVEIDTGDDWLDAAATAGDYEVKAVVNSGTLDGTSDATGSFLSLSSDRNWSISDATIGGTETASLTITIRHATDTSDSIEFDVNLEASK